jgi:hypothetical protein
MSLRQMLVVAGALVFASSLSVASGPEGEVPLQDLFAGMHDLRTTPNEALASNYPDTECIDFSLKKSSAKVGFVCASRNRQFIKEMGISEYDGLPEASRQKDRPKSSLLVATPMRQYEMRTFGSSADGVASAVVDCETEGVAIYRATSSCHVAVSRLGDHEVIYSNFVVTYHNLNKRGISLNRIKKVWQALDRRAR